MLQRASEKGELVSVALNTHGTRAVQKLIETLTSREQVPRWTLPFPASRLAAFESAATEPVGLLRTAVLVLHQ